MLTLASETCQNAVTLAQPSHQNQQLVSYVSKFQHNHSKHHKFKLISTLTYISVQLSLSLSRHNALLIFCLGLSPQKLRGLDSENINVWFKTLPTDSNCSRLFGCPVGCNNTSTFLSSSPCERLLMSTECETSCPIHMWIPGELANMLTREFTYREISRPAVIVSCLI